jgi:peptidoglycan hydrolase CwlO-like protein
MKQAPWILSCILFGVILYMQTCKTKPVTVPKSEYDALVKSKEDTVKHFNAIIKADDAAIEAAKTHAVQSAERAIRSEAKVTEGQSEIKRLNAKIDAGRKEKPDSSFVAVSPRYVEGCDSLSLISGIQDIRVDMYKKDNADLKAAKEQEIAARDKKLKDQKDFNDALQKQLDSCQDKVKEKEKSAKVKNQWYGIVGITGNKLNPIAGGEGGITLINKKGVLYGIKGELLAGQLWVGVKTGVRLFR